MKIPLRETQQAITIMGSIYIIAAIIILSQETPQTTTRMGSIYTFAAIIILSQEISKSIP